MATKRFIKLFVDVNKSISEQNKDTQAKKNTHNPISIKAFQKFQAIIKRISDKQKNRKPGPAVGVIYFWFYTGFLVSSLRK